MKDFEDDDETEARDAVGEPQRNVLASPILWLSSIAFWIVIAYLVL
ncbi:MAG: hypothetical protein AAF675_17685 [Pseudomonadota bacterium]